MKEIIEKFARIIEMIKQGRPNSEIRLGLEELRRDTFIQSAFKLNPEYQKSSDMSMPWVDIRAKIGSMMHNLGNKEAALALGNDTLSVMKSLQNA